MAFLKCIKNSRVIPNGKTVTPTDDVQIWLHCADIWDKSYTTVSEVLNDSTTTFVLMTNDNAVDYMIRSTTSFMYAICYDGYAMTVAGASDYTAYAMLNDATWCDTVFYGHGDYLINVSVPKMTSATAPSGEVTADSTYANYYAWYPFRENNTTAWISNHNVAKNATASGWLQYMFKRVVKIYGLKYTEPTNISQVTAFTVKASNDGINFTDIATDSKTFVPVDKYQYWRMQMTAKNVYSSATYVPRILTMQFYGRENGGVQTWLRAAGITDKTYTSLAELFALADASTISTLFASTDACDYLVTAKGFLDQCNEFIFMTALGNSNYASTLLLSDDDWYEAIVNSQYSGLVLNAKVPKMTGDTTPSGEAYASSYASSYQPWKAFNQSTSSTTCWSWSGSGAVANNAWLAYDFGKAVKIYGVFWQNRTTSQATRPLGTLIVQGSNDKTTWTDVSDTLTGSATASATFSYHFANTNAYRHYRVLITSTAVTGDTNLIIQQLQFYGREDVA